MACKDARKLCKTGRRLRGLHDRGVDQKYAHLRPLSLRFEKLAVYHGEAPLADGAYLRIVGDKDKR